VLLSCKRSNNFTSFLSDEIGAVGGYSNRLDHALSLSGSWKITRDQFGVAIDTDGVQFTDVSNLLTSVYGEPAFYTGSNERHGVTYLYPVTNVGASIFIASTKRGAEITLTKIQR
jgi:hypothetical protein